MHPDFYVVWRTVRSRLEDLRSGAMQHCGPSGGRFGCGPTGGGDDCGDSNGGGNFGVRRPLRFLAHKLQLTDAQVGALAKILHDLKTERAQAEVDDRRAQSGLADALAGEAFDADRADKAGAQRVKSVQHLQAQVVAALQQIHALLSTEQRQSLAYLIRTGTLAL